MADNDIIDFPLEIDHNIPDNAIRETETRTKLVQNFDEVIHNPPPRAAEKIIPRHSADKSEKAYQEAPVKSAPQESPVLTAELAVPAVLTAEDDKTGNTLQMAAAESHEPEAIFPLEKTVDPLAKNVAAKVLRNAEANRVALAGSNRSHQKHDQREIRTTPGTHCQQKQVVGTDAAARCSGRQR